jgi:hypothetical protein
VNEDELLVVTGTGVLENDRPTGSFMTAILENTVSHGTLNLSTNGTFTYRPDTNFYGTDTFIYRAKNNNLPARSYPAMVTITVLPVPDPATAVADSYTVNGNGSLTVAAPGVLGNDTDPNGYPLTALLAQAPGFGTLTLQPDGSFIYSPTNGFTGVDSFKYRANNGETNSNLATVQLTVVSPLPDFIVTDIALMPTPVMAAGKFMAHVTVKNQGTAASTAGALRIWMNSPGSDLPSGTAGDSSVTVGNLAVGASTTLVFSALTPPTITPVGANQMSPTFRAFINATGTQSEFALNNNQLTLTYKVQASRLADYYPPDIDGIDTDGDGNVTNDYAYVRLAAGDGFVKMADGRDMYVFGFSDATGLTEAETMMNNMVYAGTPAPTLVFKEGQRVFLKLTNVGMMFRPDLFDPHTVHFHGFPNAAPIFDGEPMASVSVNMGNTFTYYYEPVEPGTFMYHCHVEASEHMQMGMLGMLWVLPKQNNLPNNTDLKGFTHHTGYKYAYNDGDGSTYYDVNLPLQISGMDSAFHDSEINIQPLPLANMHDDYFLLNGRGYADTVNTNILLNKDGVPAQQSHAKCTARVGEKILLRISSLATVDFTTLSSSLPMKVVGRSARLLRGPDPVGGGTGKNLYYMTTSVTLGGGETYDAIIDTAGVTPGTYFIYSSNLNQLSNGTEDFGGIMTEIEITAP